MLSHYLTPDVIRLRVAVPDWGAAVRVAGELLVRTGACAPAYIDAIIDAVHTMGPYIVLAPGLALAHARPESGVYALGISLVTLDPPVPFGMVENDPVFVVIAFGAIDDDGHIDMLAALAGLLSDEQRYQQIRAASTADEVLCVIRGYEQMIQ